MLNALLVFVPVAIALEHLAPSQHLWIFAAAALAILPLAGWMGHATEHLAARMGEGVGGLLNATFGNAAELIIALAALRAGLHEVVKASIAGAIVGNILLVLGAAMLAGGLRHRPEQQFNAAGARSTTFHSSTGTDGSREVTSSHVQTTIHDACRLRMRHSSAEPRRSLRRQASSAGTTPRNCASSNRS